MSEKENEKLGFCDLPILRYIFIGGTENEGEVKSAWYYLGADSKQVGIPEFGLRGILTALKIKKTEFKGKANFKLDIFVQADKPYAIRSGINTTFSRGIVLALYQYLTDTGDLSEPFTFGVQQGEDAKVVFSSLFNHQNTRVKFEWDKECTLGGFVYKIQEALGQDLEADTF